MLINQAQKTVVKCQSSRGAENFTIWGPNSNGKCTFPFAVGTYGCSYAYERTVQVCKNR